MVLRVELQGEDFSNSLTFILGYLMSPACIVGIFGNLLSVLVLIQKEMKSTVNFLLLNLAMCDILFLATQGIVFGIFDYCQLFDIWPKYRNHYDKILMPFWNWATVTGQNGSIYFTLAITVERLIVVKYPLRCKTICTLRRARFTSALIFIYSVLFGLPNYLALGYTEVNPTSNNSTNISKTDDYIHYNHTSTAFGKGRFYKQYTAWGHALFEFILPFVILAVLNMFISIQIRRAQLNRASLTSSQRADVSVTKMLLCTVLVFGICYSLLLVDSILAWIIAFGKLKPDNYKKVMIFRQRSWIVLEFLSVVNSGSNFIIYCVMGKRFRASLTQILIQFRDFLTCTRTSSLRPSTGTVQYRVSTRQGVASRGSTPGTPGEVRPIRYLGSKYERSH